VQPFLHTICRNKQGEDRCSILILDTVERDRKAYASQRVRPLTILGEIAIHAAMQPPKGSSA
jgi:hypothetical protein